MVGEGEEGPESKHPTITLAPIVATTITYLENNQNSDLKVDQTIQISDRFQHIQSHPLGNS